MTELTEFQRKIRQNLPEIVLSFDEPMREHTSFRIGGPAQVMAFPSDAAQLKKILEVSAFLDIEHAILMMPPKAPHLFLFYFILF